MTILHFSTADGPGGASRAAHRLHRALDQAGANSKMMVRTKRSDDETVLLVPSPALRRMALRAQQAVPLPNQPQPGFVFNQDRRAVDVRTIVEMAPASLRAIYLHWVTEFLTVHQVRRLWEHFRCPLIWVLHDQGPLTGGCHYSYDCTGFTGVCGRCPQLGSTKRQDRSHTVWKRRRDELADLPIRFVAPSSWSAARVRESSLFRDHAVDVIPHAIDTRVFRLFDQATARSLLGLPCDKVVIYTSASDLDDPRKGMEYFHDALLHLRRLLASSHAPLEPDNVLVVVAGRGGTRLIDGLPLPGRALGHLEDEVTLALAYQAADVFVCPSVVDSAPLVIPEALLCGTPVVAFGTGNAPDLIEHLRTGYLARHREAADLGQGVHAVLTAPDRQAWRGLAAERAQALHSPTAVAARYLALHPPK